MDVHIHGNSLKAPEKRYWYMIALADEGKGVPMSFFFTKDDLRKAVSETNVSDVSIWIEHGTATKENMGELVYWWVDDTDGLYIIARFEAGLRSSALQSWIRDGLYTGISLGYKSEYDYRLSVTGKKIYEISIVHKPFHAACRIKQILCGGGVTRIEEALDRIARKPENQDPWSALGSLAHPAI